MKITRVYAGSDGQSHFEEIEVEIDKLQPGEGIVFRHVDADALVLGIFIWQMILPARAISRELSVTSRGSL